MTKEDLYLEYNNFNKSMIFKNKLLEKELNNDWFTKLDIKPIYLKWVFSLYKRLIKSRPNLNDIGIYPDLKTLIEYLYDLDIFIEDTVKLKNDIYEYNYHKGNNLIEIIHRDIYYFKSINELSNFVLSLKKVDYDEHSLSEEEIKCIKNYNTVKNDKIGLAELIHNDNHYYIIKLHNYKASEVFSKNTIWCTRFPIEYQRYYDNNGLYVFIGKGIKYPRLQFNPGTGQFMDKHDHQYSIDNFIKSVDSFSIFESIYNKLDKYTNLDEIMDFIHSVKTRRNTKVNKWYQAKYIDDNGFDIPKNEIKILLDFKYNFTTFNLSSCEVISLKNVVLDKLYVGPNCKELELIDCKIGELLIDTNNRLTYLIIQHTTLSTSFNISGINLTNIKEFVCKLNKGIVYDIKKETINKNIKMLVINGCDISPELIDDLHSLELPNVYLSTIN